jgi:hypothetical protein
VEQFRDSSWISRQTQAESPRKPTARHRSQNFGYGISYSRKNRNRGKRVGMLDDSDDDDPPAVRRDPGVQ